MIRPLDLQDDSVWAMFVACRAGDLELVRKLVEGRRDLASCEYNYTPPLHFAVREGHLPVVRFLLENGADAVTYRSYPFQETLVTMAQDRGHDDVAACLLERVARQFPVAAGIAAFLEATGRGDLARVLADLQATPALAYLSDESGNTALHQAVLGGHVGIMTALLDAGANVDAARADGVRPVHCALRHHPELADALFARGAARTIYLSAVLGDEPFVRAELARDSSLSNFQDSSGHRPISAAASRNDLPMVKLLLHHGANPSLPEHGAPLGLALWTAVYQNQPEMVQLLLEHGANPNTAPESSGPAILHARNRPELKALLLKYGAEDLMWREEMQTRISDNKLNEVERRLRETPAAVRDDLMFWGEGLLAGPANRGHREMLELLIRYGAQVPEVTKWGPEYYFKHAAIGALLLERGMNPNHRNWQEFTLLHHMAAQGLPEKARVLLDHGANIDAVDEEYCSTPLGCAARWGRVELVELLLERGADPNRSGAAWSTPLNWALRKGHPEIAARLRRAGAHG